MNPLTAYQSLHDTLEDSPVADWLRTLPKQLKKAFSNEHNGNYDAWATALGLLPKVTKPSLDYTDGILRMASEEIYPADQLAGLETALHQLHPWRKGPLSLANLHIDTEWHSDWKWDRLQYSIADLSDRCVLDVGCGNGYHCWHMLQAGAKRVIGIDSALVYVMQFLACKHFVGQLPVWVLPLAIEDLPSDLPVFDSVFSMGILHHRRSPLDHLFDLRRLLRPAGELVLETLVIDARPGYSLLPSGRYAQMRNVWFLPSCATLGDWMKRCGFIDIKLVDMTKTSIEEQHSTDWMQFQSLCDFLDPGDHSKTIEGHPAPVRAIFTAKRRE